MVNSEIKWKSLDEQDTQLVVAVLKEIERELLRCFWNKHQKEMDSPFQNTGNSYITADCFSVYAYDWSERNELNFIYSDIYHFSGSMYISWYKHLGRGDYVRVQDGWKISDLSVMLDNCIKAIRKDFGEDD